MGNLGEKMGNNKIKILKCASFQYGNQERNTKAGTKKRKYKEVEGLLNRNQLEPGKLIFSDKYESRLPGRVFGYRGYIITSQVYKGVTILCDAAYRNISVHCRVSSTPEDTILSKLKF